LTNDVYIRDLKTNKYEFMKINFLDNNLSFIDKEYYFKGFAKYKDGFLVGVVKQEKNRKNRDDFISWVLLFDNNWNYLDKFATRKEEQIKDIRVVDEIDYGHSSLIYDSSRLIELESFE